MEKKCFKCGEYKPLSDFYAHKAMADGHLNKCKTCTKSDNNQHRDKNLERVKKADRDRYAANPEKKKSNARRYYGENREQCLASSVAWIKNNPEKRKVITQRYDQNNPGRISRYEKERKARDPVFAMMKRLRMRLHHAVRAAGTKKADHTLELIGCTPRELCEHLETLFLPDMTWENRSEWHIDHKRPVSSFDLRDPDQQRECFYYTNLQPLWGEDNLKKGNRTDK